MTQTSPKQTPKNDNSDTSSIDIVNDSSKSSSEKLIREASKTTQLQLSEKNSWWDQLSIQSKGTIVAIAIGIIPMLVVGGSSYLFAKQIVNQRMNQQGEVAQQIDLEIKKDIFLILSLATVITGLLVTLVAKILAKQGLKSIKLATEAIEKISQGYLDTRLDIKGQDDLASLGNNINKMAERIQLLVKETDLTAKQSAQLKDITLKIYAALDAKEVFEITLREIRQLLETDRVIIYRFDENWKGTIIYESVGEIWPKALGASIADPCFAERYVEKYQQGRVQATPDIYKAGLTDCHIQQLAPLAVKANLVAPILVKGQLLGLLITHQCSSTRNWERSEIDLFAQIATQLGLSLERVDLMNQQNLNAQRSALIKDITIKLSNPIDTDTIFEIAIKEIRLALSTNRVIIYRFDEQWQGTVIAESVEEKWPRAFGSTIYDPCFAEKYVDKYKKGRVIATPDIYQAGLTECHIKQLEPFSVKANLVAPILVDGELIGLLIAHQCSSQRNWTQSEIDLFAQIATQVGLSIERSELIEKQKVAEIEQRTAKEQLQRRALELLMEVDPVSQGDLTIRAQVTADEIGTIADSYNATIESLRRLVMQVQRAAEQVTLTTNTNEISVQNLSTEAMRQTKEITKALIQIHAMSESIRSVVVNAEEAEKAVKLSAESVASGDIAMNLTVDGIMGIRATVAETTKKVKRLGESTQKISKVVNLISSFAEQTNLLALNASIEAAHAGEEGRGFAVVADEVRSLAKQSAEATAEIEKVVAQIQAETNEVVTAMETGTEQVVTGTRLVEETRQKLNQITAASGKINQLVAAITTSALEQAKTSEAVSESMTGVAKISEDTNISAHQVSDAFQQLLQVAQDLQSTVNKFKVK